MLQPHKCRSDRGVFTLRELWDGLRAVHWLNDQWTSYGDERGLFMRGVSNSEEPHIDASELRTKCNIGPTTESEFRELAQQHRAIISAADAAGDTYISPPTWDGPGGELKVKFSSESGQKLYELDQMMSGKRMHNDYDAVGAALKNRFIVVGRMCF